MRQIWYRLITTRGAKSCAIVFVLRFHCFHPRVDKLKDVDCVKIYLWVIWYFPTSKSLNKSDLHPPKRSPRCLQRRPQTHLQGTIDGRLGHDIMEWVSETVAFRRVLSHCFYPTNHVLCHIATILKQKQAATPCWTKNGLGRMPISPESRPRKRDPTKLRSNKT